ncbi:MAG: NUDIX domain-containing protein [Candidatus Pacebacteria bacterium]|nr:NUDIX domain-containing protein [Candidatus Paceibacterota bacterium]
MDTPVQQGQVVVRCRAVIVYEGALLVVRHAHDATFAPLPGGHLEWGEDPVTCLEREILEELGVEPEVGRLLYVHTFTNSEGKHSVEFLFEVTNGIDFIHRTDGAGTHAYEIAETVWVSPDAELRILPQRVATDFRTGTLFNDIPRFFSTCGANK